MKQNRIALLLLTTTCLVGFQTAQATLLEEWDTARLTKESGTVQIGEVTSQWSSWDSEKNMIFTYVTLRIDQTLKGQSTKEVMIRLPGGEANGTRMVVHGMASFRPNEKALVFLKQDSDGNPSVVGMAQGKYKIIRNRVTGEETALFHKPENLEFVTRALGGQRHVVSSPSEKRVPLRNLIQEIQLTVRSEESVAQ